MEEIHISVCSYCNFYFTDRVTGHKWYFEPDVSWSLEDQVSLSFSSPLSVDMTMWNKSKVCFCVCLCVCLCECSYMCGYMCVLACVCVFYKTGFASLKKGSLLRCCTINSAQFHACAFSFSSGHGYHSQSSQSTCRDISVSKSLIDSRHWGCLH